MATTASRCHGRTVLLTLALLVALAGCGPGEGPEARGTGQEVGSSKEAASPSANPASPLVPSPAPRASSLLVPDWMAKDLASPDAQVRLKAVETWGQSAPNGSVDPLIQALEDQDEQVQARALELIEQDWAREQAAKPPP